MSRIETVTSPQTPGAGRRMSYTWPSTGRVTNLNEPTGGVDATGRPNGVASTQYFNNTITGAPPAPRGMVIYKRRVAWAMSSDNATGYANTPNFGGVNRPLIMPFGTVRMVGGGGNLLGMDDFACWSVSAILAFDALPGVVVGDIGLVVGVGTRFIIRGATNQFAGMEIGPSDVGVTSVFVRQADTGAVTFNQATPFQPDQTTYHQYEIRLIAASANTEAAAKFLIDGRLQFSLPWGAGTVLPDQVLGGAGNLGFTPALGNLRATAAGVARMYLATNGLRVCCGPTEESLL